MNIKIKAAGVVNVLGTDYDRIYNSLKGRLTQPEEQLFTERTPGHEYLQWDLPEEDWTSLTKADPLMESQVKAELEKRKQKIISYFSNNLILADKILSVPDDSYVYFKVDDKGWLDIKLTAWGYKFPERVGTGAAIGHVAGKQKKIPVKIKIISDGQPVADKELLINNMKRHTNAQGEYPVGDLPVGYQFELGVEDKRFIVTANPGNEEFIVDITPPKPEVIELPEITETPEQPDEVEEQDNPEQPEKTEQEEEIQEPVKPDEPNEPEKPGEDIVPEPTPDERKRFTWIDLLGILALVVMTCGAFIGCWYILF